MLIAGRNIFAQLNLNHVKFRLGYYSVLAACLHGNDVAGLDGLFHPVNNRFAATADYRPYFIAAVMTVVIHMVSGTERDFDRHAFVFHVKHAEISQDFSANMIC